MLACMRRFHLSLAARSSPGSSAERRVASFSGSKCSRAQIWRVSGPLSGSSGTCWRLASSRRCSPELAVIRRIRFALAAFALASGAVAQSAPSFAVSSYPTGGSALALAVGDWNRDGKPDVVTAQQPNGTLSILYGDGQGGFAAPVTISFGLPAGVGPT